MAATRLPLAWVVRTSRSVPFPRLHRPELGQRRCSSSPQHHSIVLIVSRLVLFSRRRWLVHHMNQSAYTPSRSRHMSVTLPHTSPGGREVLQATMNQQDQTASAIGLGYLLIIRFGTLLFSPHARYLQTTASQWSDLSSTTV